MSRPGFGEGVLIALLAALLASFSLQVLALFMPGAVAAHLVSVGLGFGYGLYLLARAPRRAGAVVMVLVWLPISLVAAALFADLWVQILTQIGLIWLARLIHRQAGPLAALLDLGLLLFGLAAAIWTLERTGGLLLSVWTFFLLQAFFPRIPSCTDWARADPVPSDPFEQAERTAERALCRLARPD